MSKLIILAIAPLLFFSPLRSQDYRWRAVFIDGTVADGLTLVASNADSLTVEKDSVMHTFQIGALKELRHPNPSMLFDRIGLCSKIGGAVGLILGVLLAHEAESEQATFYRRLGSGIGVGLVGGVLGAIVGVIIDGIKSADTVYDFATISPSARASLAESLVAQEQERLRQK